MKKRLWMDGCRAASMMLAGMVAVVAPAMAQRTTVQTVQTTQQVQQAQQAQQAQQTVNTSTRFVEACNSAENNGQPTPGCQNVPQLRGKETDRRPGDVLFLPYLVGTNAPEFDRDACGVFFGLRRSHDAFDLALAAAGEEADKVFVPDGGNLFPRERFQQGMAGKDRR